MESMSELLESSFDSDSSKFGIDDNWTLLDSLTLAELCLLISCKLHQYDNGHESFNFETVYRAYDVFACKYCRLLRHPRSIMMKVDPLTAEWQASVNVIGCFI